MTTQITELYDKFIKAGQNVPVYRNPNDLKKPLQVFKKGAIVGRVYSHVRNKNGDLFLMFQDKVTDKPYYMLYQAASVDRRDLRSQGVRTTKEIEDEKREKMNPGIFSGSLKKYLLPAAAVLAALFVLKN